MLVAETMRATLHLSLSAYQGGAWGERLKVLYEEKQVQQVRNTSCSVEHTELKRHKKETFSREINKYVQLQRCKFFKNILQILQFLLLHVSK